MAAALTPTDIVVFGGLGDLALQKIYPALYYRHKDGQLPDGRIIGVDFPSLATEGFVEKLRKACEAHVQKDALDAKSWKSFVARLHYIAIFRENNESYEKLGEYLAENPRKGRMFYLAIPSNAFGEVCHNLKAHGLTHSNARVVLEKPIGHDFETFNKINNHVLCSFPEERIYRIDHYLGKETVQNLMILRFANNIFSRMWNSDAIEHVQITAAESVGVGSRGGYFDAFGTLRDMVQNHLLQLLCLVAMEPPNQITPHVIRDEKIKVLKALQRIRGNMVLSHTVRGQYRAGTVDGKNVPGYLQDINKKASNTESFVAIKTFVENWRWSGVPFYLRTGKRLQAKCSEIMIQFRHVPHHIFPNMNQAPDSNKLILRLQPDESVKLQIVSKTPGPGGYRLKPVTLDLSLTEAFGESRFPDAYERLLIDVIRGNPTLFMHAEEVAEAWKWTSDILAGWEEYHLPLCPYKAGTDGPKEANKLITADGREWHMESDV